MNFKNENGTLTVFLEGRLDSSNAESVRNELVSIYTDHPADVLILDIEKLGYISSAGLRVILYMRRLYPGTRVIGASPEVWEIFEMTGFTEMMPIEKAYRAVSVEGCEVIGRGSNGMVYRLDPDTVIKVYNNPDSLPDIHRERELARKAFVMGIPTAISYDVVKVGEGYGSVFELLNAKSFTSLIMEDPANIDRYVGLYVDLLRKLHSTELKPGEIPSMKEVALKWAYFLGGHLPAAECEKLVSLIAAVPEDNHMLHGDYHVKNVMMQNGEVLLIDMDTLCTGNPVFEFASIFLAYVGFGETDPGVMESFMGLPFDRTQYIWQKTLELYFGTTDEAVLTSYADRARVIGYTRLLRRTIRRESGTEAGQALIAHCKAQLSALLARTDSLAF